MPGSDERLAIPLGELSEFAPRLRSVKDFMNRTGNTFDRYDDALGDSRVVDALDDFVSGWEDGREDITQQLTGLADMADTVVTTVNDYENELTRSLTEGGESGG
ncbi:hypothetical protein [Streptomyces radicis]|uniref:WXG100 family type VII secretion target n=1 Tax=Streptomyces radicis TaxID=1750517 RepID=A0A3A9W5C7_9ACTN|nr:hypothetical protein [Streptomyces radicis]RKN07633.1 hypothetical protein D7319_18420 [Streptomyces radicis]RKN18356.1 hypothetical protein D7318_22655 [Streptomyces radicis]